MKVEPPFTIRPNSSPVASDERTRLLAEPGFGKVFTDHMITMTWTSERGWHDIELRAREPFSLDPANAVFHYAQEIFEGMKAYRTDDGRVALFRPSENARRFRDSAARMAMPPVPDELFLAAVRELVTIDRDWIPVAPGSLYLRPFMFANEAFLGVRQAAKYTFCVIASPVGPYFKGGEKPITVWVSESYSRAAPGGTGAAKCGGNYAGSLIAQAEASAHHCDQVLFLDAAEHSWIEELGGMNIFFVTADGRIVTPPLGTILPGITRESIIAIARGWGLAVDERPYSFREWREDSEAGRVVEAFACGTAAVVASIGKVCHAAGTFTIGDGAIGATTGRLRDELVGIQRGARQDTRGWLSIVGEAGQ